MARSELSPAKSLLLAVQLATKSDLSTLRTLVSRYPKTFHTDIVLRVLLSHLPESLESAEYVPFLQDLTSGNVVEDSSSTIDLSSLEGLSDAAASKRVRKLHLLPLIWPNAPSDAPSESLVQFLIHRSLRIDEYTGLITQLPELLVPFLHLSEYLRTWMISIVLPLVRLNYEYHPHDGPNISMLEFESLDDQAGIAELLSRTGDSEAGWNTVGRDLKGLVGPWMYGDTRTKRRRLRNSSSFDRQSVEPLDEVPVPAVNEKYASWEEVFNWVTTQASTTWRTAVHAVEQWDGPGDVDLGGYNDGNEWLDEVDQQYLERRYARAALACAYNMPDESMETLLGIRRILGKLYALLDLGRLPTLEVAGALLSPVSGVHDVLFPSNAAFLRDDLLKGTNVLTTPSEASIKFLHALIVSTFLFERAGLRIGLRRVGHLALLQDHREQNYEFERIMTAGNGRGGHVSDDKYWIRVRNELLWLRSWGAEEGIDGSGTSFGKGVFGRLPKETIEVAILKGLLSNNRIPLARKTYESSPEPPISHEVLLKAILSEAMNAYDNATNANKTRGGLKRSHDILKAFPETLDNAWEAEQIEHLIDVTHAIGDYRLVFKQGEPFKPVTLRVHGDPISIIGKILDQNRRSYTKINEFVGIGQSMVLAGLTFRNLKGVTTIAQMTEEQIEEQKVIAEKRVVSMCIDAALAEDDFETAYSYIMTRLVNIAGPAQERSPEHERNGGLFAELPPKAIDDWSWRAALQAGKYRRTSQTIKPTHLGNASGNPDIRHLEQRMDCLSHAVRLAPKSTLQEILNVFRRCEEELESLSNQEAEQEAAWDAQGDQKVMPGGFGAAPKKLLTTKPNPRLEEAPMSLFDLSKGAVARAQSGLGALSMLNRTGSTQQQGGSGASTPDFQGPRERKRDQLRDAAVGTFAAGVGWLVGAPPPPNS